MKFQETLKLHIETTYNNDDLWPLFLRFIKEKGISKRWILARKKEIDNVPSRFLDGLISGESLLSHNTIVFSDNRYLISNFYTDNHILKFDSEWREIYHIYTTLKKSKIYKIKRFIKKQARKIKFILQLCDELLIGWNDRLHGWRVQ